MRSNKNLIKLHGQGETRSLTNEPFYADGHSHVPLFFPFRPRNLFKRSFQCPCLGNFVVYKGKRKTPFDFLLKNKHTYKFLAFTIKTDIRNMKEIENLDGKMT